MSAHFGRSPLRRALLRLRLELSVLPVCDVDRAKDFYETLGRCLDVGNTADEEHRAVHFTPPRSECSIIFGDGMTAAKAGSTRGLHLIGRQGMTNRQIAVELSRSPSTVAAQMRSAMRKYGVGSRTALAVSVTQAESI
ncbi:LuxR C-terminal-related transcriptional regulator [Streptomyces sp. NPDC005708]|uniref:helix-turn-helix domain-containing protein n=1 Tax=Streptomyces sp. NPDC005708 TaxID=3154564 RepID=UPI0033F68A89